MQPELAQIVKPQSWEILNCIAKGFTSATSIGDTLDLSTAYVTNQLALLEAFAVIKKTSSTKAKVGKPRKHFRIAEQKSIIGLVSQNDTFIKLSKANSELTFLLATERVEDDSSKYSLRKFYYTHEKLVAKLTGAGILKAGQKEINLLVVTNEVSWVRKKYSNINIDSGTDKQTKIILWSHTKQEIIDGVNRNEEYFIEKVKKVKPLFEKQKGLFTSLKVMVNKYE